MLSSIRQMLTESVDTMTEQFTDLKISIATDVSKLTARVGQLETKLDMTTVRVEKLEKAMNAPAISSCTIQDTKVFQQLKDMEVQIAALKTQAKNDEHERTMLVGGLGSFDSKDKACEWIQGKVTGEPARD